MSQAAEPAESSLQTRIHRRSRSERLKRLPWWLIAFALLAVFFLILITANEEHSRAFSRVRAGIRVTIFVTLVAYGLAIVLGLFIGLARTARNTLIYQVSTFYVEIVRGVPMLVLLFYIALVAGPEIVTVVNFLGRRLIEIGILASLGERMTRMRVSDLSFTIRAILALTIGYSAFLSEVFRAGIESIGKGQREAALSVGMSHWQMMRYIILPQAIRNVLPPLGNNFVAMLKDSSLVSIVGVQDITRIGDTHASNTFRFFESFNVVTYLYLVMTIVLSLLVRYMERRLGKSTRE